jgi:hypothetical protein
LLFLEKNNVNIQQTMFQSKSLAGAPWSSPRALLGQTGEAKSLSVPRQQDGYRYRILSFFDPTSPVLATTRDFYFDFALSAGSLR